MKFKISFISFKNNEISQLQYLIFCLCAIFHDVQMCCKLSHSVSIYNLQSIPTFLGNWVAKALCENKRRVKWVVKSCTETSDVPVTPSEGMLSPWNHPGVQSHSQKPTETVCSNYQLRTINTTLQFNLSMVQCILSSHLSVVPWHRVGPSGFPPAGLLSHPTPGWGSYGLSYSWRPPSLQS